MDPIIENVEKSSLGSVYGLIMKKPFDAISKHGFISKVSKNGAEYFQLDETLLHKLNQQDIQSILDTVNQKLVMYFARIDPKWSTKGKMKDFIETILDGYSTAKQETFAGHLMGTYFRNDIPNAIYSTGIVNSSFSFGKYTRSVNHIVAYLDRITVYGRILKDDVSVAEYLDSFTLAQITEFIKLASENNCTNVTALLLEHQNEHFSDFDPMDEFTLE